MFAWEHLKDHLDQCCYILASGALTITPPFIPVRTLPYFQGDVRRVYLSATLNAPDSFARTFGKVPERIIAPETPAGACERLILAPILRPGTENDVSAVSALIATRKALIMTPNYLRSAMWESVATTPDKDHVTAAVNEFKRSHAPAKLLLTARYDGVDLPGDTCRIMIIDDLPSATGPLERFMWEYLRMSKTLRTTIASRIVQSFGRISRGMSDYGIVFLTGESLVKWLSTPQNQMALPQFLQKQLLLGYQISENINPAEIGNTIDRCLDRDESWISAYENFMDTAVPLAGTRNTSIETELAISEAKFASAMWRRDFVSAAAILTGTLESAQQLSASTQAWHLFWIAAATEIAGDPFKDGTAKGVTQAVKHFQTVMGNTDPGGITSKAVSEFYRKLNGTALLPGNQVKLDTTHKKSEATARTYATRVATFARWFGIEVAALKFKGKTPARKTVIPLAKVEELLAIATGDLKFVLLAGFRAGMRRGEIVWARPSWFNLDSENPSISIPCPDPVTGWMPKTGVEREIPLVSEFADFIRATFPDWKKQAFCIRPEKQPGDWIYRFDDRKMFDGFTSKNCPRTHSPRDAAFVHLPLGKRRGWGCPDRRLVWRQNRDLGEALFPPESRRREGGRGICGTQKANRTAGTGGHGGAAGSLGAPGSGNVGGPKSLAGASKDLSGNPSPVRLHRRGERGRPGHTAVRRQDQKTPL